MSKASQELERAIILEGKNTGYWDRLKYWKKNVFPKFPGADEPTPPLKTALTNIPPHELIDSDIRALVASAGNFIWGQKVYELGKYDRARIAGKIECGEPLSKAEQLWIDSTEIDTDMF